MTRRGSSNGNSRGGSDTRRRRREWLVATYRADANMTSWCAPGGVPVVLAVQPPDGQPACRCYRCGTLLTVDTVSVDRIIPGCQGGTYRRNNIRPACLACNSETGGAQRARPVKP